MKAFIITLSKIESSLETASNLKSDLEFRGIEAELFEGTYGHDVEQLLKKESRIPHPVEYTGEPMSEKHRTRISKKGVIGCFYSHYRLWRKCIEMGEPIMIFEDDAVLSRSYYPVEWEGVLLLCMGFEWKKSHKFLPFLDNPTGEPCAIEYKDGCVPGAVGYAIKPEAAKALCKKYSKTYDAADLAINTNNVKIYHHSHLMGRALVKADGKQSLTKTKFWDKK